MYDIVKKFGKRVKKIRLDKQMSQGDIAKILNVHRAYVSGVERGTRNPSLRSIEKIAKALKVRINHLLNW